jgi:hypothetical protein
MRFAVVLLMGAEHTRSACPNEEEEEKGVTRATQAATLQLNPASEGTHPAWEGGRMPVWYIATMPLQQCL